MCGIAGIVLKNKNSFNLKETIFKTSQSIKHRGPDGEGFLLIGENTVPCSSKDTSSLKQGLNYIPKKNISEANGDFHLALAHRRLSILDLSETGHQPMALQDGKLWITYNGEIYNYLELKKELEAEGAKFVSTSDTEVILYAYKHWGTDCLDKFNGMWSFCIYNEEKQELFCSRDRFGVKPFYYTDNDNVFAFASEQKALVKGGLVKAEINKKALHDYLINNRMEEEENNFFGGISELWPGYYLKYNLKNHSFNTACYYKLNSDYDYSTDLQSNEELVAEVKEKLTNAVNLRLRSDVPVGSCLSGGIDSSALAALMEQKNPVYLFTSVFQNEKIDESYYARLVANKINCIHKTIEPTADGLFKELETLVYAQDVPIWDTSTYAQYKVMELAKQNNIKVVLDGQGADELFAGYHHHFIAKWNNLLGYGNIFGFSREIHQSKKTIETPFALFVKEKIKANYNSYLKEVAPYFDKGFTDSYKIHNQTKYFDNVNKQLAYDITNARLKSFLKCEDRCGMWHSVESRTPFSDDIELINLMFSINGNRKIQKGVSKFFLREAVKDKLPQEIYERYDKKGFETPMNKWIKGNYKKMFEILNPFEFDFVNLDKLKKKFDSETADTKEIKLLYKLYILALWNKIFIQ
jgi:asparagine synthase (glutamine-hydrolysing)